MFRTFPRLLSKPRAAAVPRGSLPGTPKSAPSTAAAAPPTTILPPLPETPSAETLRSLFPSASAAHASYFLRALQHRRTTGSLLARGVLFPAHPQVTPALGQRALDYLRDRFPVDEAGAARAWLAAELDAAEAKRAEAERDELVGKARRWRLYARPDPAAPPAGAADDAAAELEDGKGRYGRELSVLDALKRENERRERERVEREEKEEAERVAQAQAEGREITVAEPKSFWDGVVAKTPEQQEAQEKKMEADLKAGMVSEEEKVPEMTTTQRLGPSAAFTAAVVGLSLGALLLSPTADAAEPAEPAVPAAAAADTDPDSDPSSTSTANRPSALATLAANPSVALLLLANTALFIGWRRPGLWKTLNTHAIVVAGKPTPSSMLGSAFSHTSGWHYLSNMLALYLIGTRLGTSASSNTTTTTIPAPLLSQTGILAVYLSTGTLASFATLAAFTARGALTLTSLGASGAIWGLLGTYVALVPAGVLPYHVEFPSIGFERTWEIPSYGLLAALLALDQLIRIPGVIIGKSTHLAGALAGVAVGNSVAAVKPQGANQKEQN